MTKNKQSDAIRIFDYEHQELCQLYQNAADNLVALKKSQWQVFAFFSATAAFLITQVSDKLPNTKNDVFYLNPQFWIFIAFLIGAIGAVFMLRWYQKKSMSVEREVLHNIYNQFSPLFRKCRSPKEDVRESDFFEKGIIKWGGALYIGFLSALTMYIFWKDHCVSVCCYWAIIPICCVPFIGVVCSLLCIDKFIDCIKMKEEEEERKRFLIGKI